MIYNKFLRYADSKDFPVNLAVLMYLFVTYVFAVVMAIIAALFLTGTWPIVIGLSVLLLSWCDLLVAVIRFGPKGYDDIFDK